MPTYDLNTKFIYLLVSFSDCIRQILSSTLDALFEQESQQPLSTVISDFNNEAADEYKLIADYIESQQLLRRLRENIQKCSVAGAQQLKDTKDAILDLDSEICVSGWIMYDDRNKLVVYL